ncbi:hypothetical protein B0J11DRAFT_483916 [Dendryphion nanum]|uniref:TLDc domain-containing protein n=1 Tax=Dendryphion nanum TaxID=256645 RepID=A0A9P9E034_9PLEO|nr:hypothetical protein B0J11DRAFT_483916 [Dendryphion nanum]
MDPENLEHGRELIETWFADGQMTKDAILQVLSSDAATSNMIFKETEIESLRAKFQEICARGTDPSHLSEDAFIAFLDSTGTIPAPDQDASRIIYRSICYLSYFPFSSEFADPISFEAFVRGFAWMDPERAQYMTISSNFTRSRSPADHRRLLFQSLAEIDGKLAPFDEEFAFSEAHRRAFDFPDALEWYSAVDWASTNYDYDGDELYHDLLDILHSTHPRRDNPPLAPIHREAFRHLGKRLHDGDLKLYHLIIPRDRFKALVKLLLSYGYENSAAKADVEDWERSANNITNAFVQKPEEGINWFMFDDTFMNVAPYLFKPLHRLISEAFLGADPSNKTSSYEQFKKAKSILTPAIISQLTTIFYDTISLEDMIPVKHVHPRTEAASAKNLLEISSESIEEDSEGFIVIISGQSNAAKEAFTFGCYSFQPWNDKESIQARDAPQWVQCSLFQISPVHSFFPGKIGQPAWKFSDGGLQFGQSDQGAGITLGEDLRTALFTHNVLVNADTAFEAVEWKGDFSVEIEIDAIEIWRN